MADLSSEGDGGVALGLEEVLNMETVPISADLYSWLAENFVISCIHLTYGRQRSGQGGEQQFGTQVNVDVVSSCLRCGWCEQQFLL